jgi:glucokinase
MTIDFMIEIIAQCLSKFAVTILPMGGIYVGGGVANYLAKHIERKQDIFWKHFLNNELMRESLLEKIPIHILRENPTLDGL